MAITLITGTPGHGKTLFAVSLLFSKWLPEERERGTRKILTNIDGLQLTPEESEIIKTISNEELEDWHLIKDALIIVDEAQYLVRPRPAGARATDKYDFLNTHRHEGVDLVLITQHPSLIDKSARLMVEKHHHLRRPYGHTYSVRKEWEMLNENPSPRPTLLDGQESRFVFDKKYFGKYKSASQHTVKRRIPWRLVGYFGLALTFVLGVSYLGVRKFFDIRDTVSTAKIDEEISTNCVVKIYAGEYVLIHRKNRVPEWIENSHESLADCA